MEQHSLTVGTHGVAAASIQFFSALVQPPEYISL
jgi:hypothetical protein